MTLQRTAACLAFAAIAAAAGCSLIADYDGFQGGSAPDSGPALPPECGKGIPDPTPDLPAEQGTIKLTGLAQQIRFLDEKQEPSYGFDLDRACTGQNGGLASCTNNSRNVIDTDLAGGVDNKLGGFLGIYFKGNKDAITEGIRTGAHGLYVEVDRYNGKPDANGIHVALINYSGFVDGGDGRFDGTDEVIATNDSFLGDPSVNITKYVDDAAYVTHGVLVAHVSPYNLRLVLPRSLIDMTYTGTETRVVSFPLVSAALVGTIRSNGTQLLMPDAQLVGRIALPDIAAQLGNVGQCDGTSYQATLCPNLDLATKSVDDRTGKKCTAASAAIGIPIIGATRKGSVVVDPPSSLCDGGASPAFDCP